MQILLFTYIKDSLKMSKVRIDCTLEKEITELLKEEK